MVMKILQNDCESSLTLTNHPKFAKSGPGPSKNHPPHIQILMSIAF